jgi:hypothetical protein
MVPDNHLAKFVGVAKINVKSERRHTLLDLGKLGGVTNGLAEARDYFRWHPCWRDDAKPVRGVESWHAAFGLGKLDRPRCRWWPRPSRIETWPT